MNKKLCRESQKGTKQICYLMISHATYVDEIANIF